MIMKPSYHIFNIAHASKLLLCLISIAQCTKANVILAKSNACFSSTSYTTNYTFNPPTNGEIYGIRLVHQSGGVTCSIIYPSTNWGCASAVSGKRLLTQMIEQGGGTYYPTSTTQGISSISKYDGTCPNECEVIQYKMNGTYGVYNETIELIDYSNPYQVTTSQTFSLQFGEGCCDSSTSDNAGTACADVYFMYNYYEATGLYITSLFFLS